MKYIVRYISSSRKRSCLKTNIYADYYIQIKQTSCFMHRDTSKEMFSFVLFVILRRVESGSCGACERGEDSPLSDDVYFFLLLFIVYFKTQHAVLYTGTTNER